MQDFVRSNVFRIDNDKLFYKHTSSVFMRKKIDGYPVTSIENILHQN